jgi:hypothetical protein
VLEDDPAVPGAPQNDIIENNIFEDATGATSLALSGAALDVTTRYNIITRPAKAMRCAPGCILNVHPKFAQGQGGADMRLNSGSVGIDDGFDTTVRQDIRRLPRPVDMPHTRNRGGGRRRFVDIGAYELQAGASKRARKTHLAVGP